MFILAIVVAGVMVETIGFVLNGLNWPSPVYSAVEGAALVAWIWVVDYFRRRRRRDRSIA